MIADNGRDYKDLPHLTTGDEEFRSKFLSWDLGNISYTDVQEYLKVKDTILVPMASFEQHGPHLPLYTDTITAVEISKRVAEMIAVLHAPAIWMGYSPQHMYSPGSGRGTITVRSTTLLNLLYDVGRSLIHHGFNRIIFVNGHGSNVKVVDPVLRKLRYETGALISFVKPYMENYVGILKGLMENPPEETPGWHSSELETSQDLAWDERYVRMDRAALIKGAHPRIPAQVLREEGRHAGCRVRGLQILHLPDGPPRVHRERRHRQPAARDQREGRRSLPPPVRARGARCDGAGEGAGRGA